MMIKRGLSFLFFIFNLNLYFIGCRLDPKEGPKPTSLGGMFKVSLSTFSLITS